jgi:hypothetical protein
MTSTTLRTDKHGFPITDCGRCGGSGRFSFNALDADRCYGCGGTGVVHTKGSSAKAFAAFRAASKAQANVQTQDIQPGDKIRRTITSDGRAVPVYERRTAGDEWVEVTSVTRHEDQPCGWSDTHDKPREEWVPCQWKTTIAWADGLVTEAIGNQIVARFSTPDPAPFLESFS